MLGFAADASDYCTRERRDGFRFEAGASLSFLPKGFLSHREYRCAYQRAGKGGKQIKRCVISTFQVAESLWASKWQVLTRPLI